MQPSLKQLARELGVSTSLVSLVLNNRWRENNISEQTQQRVLKRLDELNYRPNRLAISLRQQKSQTVGLIIPVLTSFYEDVLRGVQRAVGSDYTLNLGVSDYQPQTERQLIVSFLERRVDGLVIIPTGDPGLAPMLREIRQKKVPLVLVDRYYRQIKTHYVGSDHVGLGRMAAEHLTAMGYRNLACFTTLPISANTMLEDRVAGIREVVDREGLPLHIFEDNVLVHQFDPARGAARALDEVLARFKLPIGVFVISSRMAESLFRECRRRGLRVPEDIGILSVDIPVSADDLYQTPLSTIRQQTEVLGQMAGEYLADMIASRRDLNRPESCKLPVQMHALLSTRLRGGQSPPPTGARTKKGDDL